jgi:hypothetical protein
LEERAVKFVAWIAGATLVLAGCGAQPRATAVAPDAQLSHADGLLSGYAGKVGSHDGRLTLQLVHQALLAKPVSFDAVWVKLPIGQLQSALYLGADHTVYAAWSDPLKPDADAYYAVGSYAGTPTAGRPLRYQLIPGARLTFEKAHTELPYGKQLPDATVLELKPLPKAAGQTPEWVKG